MCGLVGLAGNVTADMKEVFTELLLVDVVRGHHATGTALVRRYDSKFMMEKAPLPSPIFIGTDAYKKLLEQQGLKCMIGHNRFATVGEKTVSNSHPFQFENLVGAHNGTLDKWAAKNLPNSDKFGTDSEALYSAIAESSVKDAIGEVSGAWALTWYDKPGNTINMLRNNQRPLYYTYSEDRKTIFWASENDMLEWILKRHKVKLFQDATFECEADRHYRWTIPDKIDGVFDKPLVAEVKGCEFEYVPEVKHVHSAKWDASTGYGAYGNYGISQPAKRTVVAPPEKIDTSKFRPPYRDAYGHVMNKVAFNKLAATGCVYCDQAQSVWGEFIHCLKDDMDGRKLYMCEDCYNDDDIRELIKHAI